MPIPNRILEELGESAARFNKRNLEHPHGCCHVCRRLLVDMMTALTDPINWEPEPVSNQLARLQSQVEALQQNRNDVRPQPAPQAAPEEPMEDLGPPPPGFFQGSPRDEDQ